VAIGANAVLFEADDPAVEVDDGVTGVGKISDVSVGRGVWVEVGEDVGVSVAVRVLVEVAEAVRVAVRLGVIVGIVGTIVLVMVGRGVRVADRVSVISGIVVTRRVGIAVALARCVAVGVAKVGFASGVRSEGCKLCCVTTAVASGDTCASAVEVAVDDAACVVGESVASVAASSPPSVSVAAVTCKVTSAVASATSVTACRLGVWLIIPVITPPGV